MARGDILQSPWVYEAYDYQRRVIRLTVVFDNATRLVTAAQTYRDSGCRYGAIYFGLGANGKPETSLMRIPVTVGSKTGLLKSVTALGFTVIEGLLASQVTAA